MSDFDVVRIALFACQHQHPTPGHEFVHRSCARAECPQWCSRCEGHAALARIEAQDKRLRGGLEAVVAAPPHSYDWYQNRARHALGGGR